MKHLRELIHIQHVCVSSTQQCLTYCFFLSLTIQRLNCSKLLSPGQCLGEVFFERKHFLEHLLTGKKIMNILNCCHLKKKSHGKWRSKSSQEYTTARIYHVGLPLIIFMSYDTCSQIYTFIHSHNLVQSLIITESQNF